MFYLIVMSDIDGNNYDHSFVETDSPEYVRVIVDMLNDSQSDCEDKVGFYSTVITNPDRAAQLRKQLRANRLLRSL